jgi:uncharacterized RDD family membrane protein YckC
VFWAPQRDNSVLEVVGACLYVLFVTGYFIGLWSTTGQTVGNRIMDTRVVPVYGDHLPPRRAVVRLLGVIVSLPLLWGFLPILVTPRRRAVCDVMARTLVVHTAAARPA